MQEDNIHLTRKSEKKEDNEILNNNSNYLKMQMRLNMVLSTILVPHHSSSQEQLKKTQHETLFTFACPIRIVSSDFYSEPLTV